MWDTVLVSTGHDTFDPDRHWANGFMGILKSIKAPRIEKWSDFMWCIEYSLRVEQRLHICPVEYLEEVHRAAKENCTLYRDGVFATRTTPHTRTKRTFPIRNFLDFAVWVGLVSYIHMKASASTHDDLLHAAQYKGLGNAISHEAGTNRNKQLLLDLSYRTEQTMDLRPLTQVLDSAIRSKKKEERKDKWDKAKKRVFG
jgi:hypothetical protein